MQGLSRKTPAIVNMWEQFEQHGCNLAAKENGLECTTVNNDNFTVLVSGGSRHVGWARVLCGHHNNTLAHASRLMQSFFGETSSHPGGSAPLQPRFGVLWLLAFPQTKITFEREEISDHWWDFRKYNGAADGDWENCVRSQGAYFEGDWGIIVLGTMFLVSSSINFSLFHSTWLDTF